MIARLLLVSVCVCIVATQQITQAIRKCSDYPTDDRFSACFLNLTKRIQPLLKNGIPEIKLPSLEPLILENISFRQSFPPVTVEASFHNVKVYGITEFDLKYLNIALTTTRKLSLGLTVPSLTARGLYKIGGNVFQLPIAGDGDFVAVLDGIVAEGNGDIVYAKDKVFFRNVDFGFKIRTSKIRMENLFQGNQVLSDVIHHFLNENGDILLDAIRPAVSTQINAFFEKVFNSLSSVLSPDALTRTPGNQQGTRIPGNQQGTRTPSNQQGSAQRRPT